MLILHGQFAELKRVKGEVALKTLNHSSGNGARSISATGSWNINCCKTATAAEHEHPVTG